jgi:hypothetical protein
LLTFYWVFFISSASTIQMANRRNRNTNAENNIAANTAASPSAYS